LKKNRSEKTVKNADLRWFIKWVATANSWHARISPTAATPKQSLRKSALNARLVKKGKLSNANRRETESSTAANATLNVTSSHGTVLSDATARNANTIWSKRRKAKKRRLNVRTVITQKTQANNEPSHRWAVFCCWC